MTMCPSRRMVRFSGALRYAAALFLLAAIISFPHIARSASSPSANLVALTAAEQIETASISVSGFPMRNAVIFSGRFGLLDTRDASGREGTGNPDRDSIPLFSIHWHQPTQLLVPDRFSNGYVLSRHAEPIPPVNGAFFKIRARAPPHP